MVLFVVKNFRQSSCLARYGAADIDEHLQPNFDPFLRWRHGFLSSTSRRLLDGRFNWKIVIGSVYFYGTRRRSLREPEDSPEHRRP